MAAKTGQTSAAVRLTTWKEIASFLGRDESTVKRWETTRGLPVRRIPGAGRASVFAYAHELEAWLHGSGAAPAGEGAAAIEPPKRPQWLLSLAWSYRIALSIAAAAGAVGVVAALLYIYMHEGAIHDRAGSRDPVATAFYRSGLHEWQTRSPSGLSRAIADFDAAITRDPSFAEAYVGLAQSYSLSREYAAVPSGVAYARAYEAASKAVALDPGLSSAHAILGFVAFYGRRDISAARREFARAIALDPRNALAHQWNATFLMATGNFKAALAEIERAENLDSESASILADKAFILSYAGRKQEAVVLLKQIEQDQPSFASPHAYLAVIAFLAGDDAASLAESKAHAAAVHDAEEAAIAEAGAKGLAQGGRQPMLQAMLAYEVSHFGAPRIFAYSIARLFALLGDKESAFAWLAKSVARNEDANIAILTDPELNALRGDPRLPPLLARAGFAAR